MPRPSFKLTLLCMALSVLTVSAQPSAQRINRNVTLTVNTTTILHTGQTVEVGKIICIKVTVSMLSACSLLLLGKSCCWQQCFDFWLLIYITTALTCKSLPLAHSDESLRNLQNQLHVMTTWHRLSSRVSDIMHVGSHGSLRQQEDSSCLL